MKKSVLIILAFLSAISCFGQNENTLTLSQDELTFGSVGGWLTVDVTCNTEWAVSGYEEYSWLTVDTIYNSIVVEVTENMGTEQRHATLTVSAEGAESKTINVVQYWQYILRANPLTYQCIAAGDTGTINVVSNTSWYVSFEADWIEISPTTGTGNGSFQFINLPNTEYFHRQATVIVSTEHGNEQVVIIRQNAYSDTCWLSLNHDTLIYSHSGGDRNILITSNTAWRTTSSADWLSINMDYGRGTEYAVVTAQPNESETDDRLGRITFTGDGIEPHELVVIQRANVPIVDHLEVSPDSLFIEKVGGTKWIQVNTNLDYTASCPDDWVVLTTTNTSTNTRVMCRSNNSVHRRYSTITFEAEGVEPQYVHITQDCYDSTYITTSSNSMIFPATGGTQNLLIESNASWVVTSSELWLTLDTDAGSNDYTLRVTAEPYNRIVPRTANITIEQTSVGITQVRKIISVRQDPVTTVLDFNTVEGITICPNPASDKFVISNAEGENVVILNSQGQIVAIIENASNEQTIDVSNFANGTYYVKVGEEVVKINVVK